ncbi:MAG: type II toxin-antitoxin system VapC family toxin [Microcystis aeruginosa]
MARQYGIDSPRARRAMTNAFRCVVDASVAIKQFIRDPLSEKTIELFALLVEPETEFLVPDLFYIEMANILWKYLRAGQLTASQVQEALTFLEGYPLWVFSTVPLMREAVNLGIANASKSICHRPSRSWRINTVLSSHSTSLGNSR